MHRREVQLRAAPCHFRGGVLPTSAAILGHLGIESVVRVIGAKVHELLSRCHVIVEQAGYMWPTLLPASLGAKPSRCDGGSPSSSQSNSTRQLRAAGFGGVWSGMADDAAWSMLLDGVPKEGMAAESNPRRGQKRAHACRSRAADEWGYGVHRQGIAALHVAWDDVLTAGLLQ